jgi:hypothetical protein
MHLRSLLLITAFISSACFNPDEGEGAQPDASPQPDAPVPPDPQDPGVSVLASGNYTSLADKVVNGELYAVEYDGAGLLAHPARIVAISTTTGAVRSFHELTGATEVTNLRVTNTVAFWLQGSGAATILFRKPLAGGAATIGFGPSRPAFPTGYTLDMFALDAPNNIVYILMHKGADYELGSVGSGDVLPQQRYQSKVTGTIAGATEISFHDDSSMLTLLGGKLYAGGYLTAAISGGHVLELDPTNQTGQLRQGLGGTFVRSVFTAGGRAYWVTQSPANGYARLSRTDGTLMNQGFVAMLPQEADQVAALPSGAFYAISRAGNQLQLGEVAPSLDTALMPSGTTTPIASVPACQGQAPADCTIKVSSMAVDGASVYFSATTAIYKYTRP